MHTQLDHWIAVIISWGVISAFIYSCLHFESEEIETKKRNERKIIEANKNGNQRK